MQTDMLPRKVSRQRTLKPGKIVLNNRCSVLDCRVKDLSANGARLDTLGFAELPAEFELMVLPERKRHMVQRVWQKGSMVGVSFAC